jgi:hypothetical protein
MPLLYKGIYGCETDSKKTPFGLLNHQMRTDGLLNNAGWFNSAGEKIGFGDLGIQDLHKISSAIPKGESFLALSEFDTSWSIPSHLDASAPGIDYVMQNCLWYICSGAIYRVRDSGPLEEATRNGIKYTRISRPEFYKLTGYNIKKIPQPPVKSIKDKLRDMSDDEFEAVLKKVKATIAAKKLTPKVPLPSTKATLPAAGSGKYIGYKPVTKKAVKVP